MWTAPVPIFEDEDEQALIGEFVKMSALYPKHEPLEIARHIFKDLREPEMRAGQAALQWTKDLTILERIRQAKLNGGVEPKPLDTKEEKLAKLEAIYNDPDVGMKERLAAMRLHAEIQGEIVKAIDKSINDKRTPRVPQVIQGVYDDA